MPSKEIVHVAVGVIKNKHGQILIAKRADDAHQGGLWEFPGGKVEAGESVQQALNRELQEELAITTLSCKPLIQIRHDYSDKSVLLDVRLVDDFIGQPQVDGSGVGVGNEDQPIRWVDCDELGEYEFPAANRPIITALQLPEVLMITAAEGDLSVFERKLQSALEAGIRFVQLRQHQLSGEDFVRYCSVAQKLTAKSGAQLQVNSSVSIFAALNKSSSGVGLHLSSSRLMELSERPVDFSVCFGVSCHNLAELRQAQAVQADYVTLSPVLETDSHPGADYLGWDNFAEMVAEAKVPVFALGGMTENYLDEARLRGAQGVAGISSWW